MKKEPLPEDVQIGQRVRLRRMMLEMSQQTLASELGITFQQVQKYEKGANRIGGSRMVKIALVLDAPVSFFFEDVEAPRKNDSHSATLDLLSELDATGIKMIRNFVQIPDATVRRVIADLVACFAPN